MVCTNGVTFIDIHDSENDRLHFIRSSTSSSNFVYIVYLFIVYTLEFAPFGR